MKLLIARKQLVLSYLHSLSHAQAPLFGTFVALNAPAPSVEQINPVDALFALHIDEL